MVPSLPHVECLLADATPPAQLRHREKAVSTSLVNAILSATDLVSLNGIA
jgi:hypothetical protein